MAKANLAREKAIQARVEAIQNRDNAIVRANSVESEQDRMVFKARAAA